MPSSRALGTKYSRKQITLLSTGGSRTWCRPCTDHGVHRLVCVSSSVTDPRRPKSHDTGGGFVFEKVLKPFITNVIGKNAVRGPAKRMEQLMMSERPRLDDRASVRAVRNACSDRVPGSAKLSCASASHLEGGPRRPACSRQAEQRSIPPQDLAVATVAVEAADGQASCLKEAFGISIGGSQVQPAR